MAVGAFERPHERPLLGPAIPLLVLLLHLQGIGLVMSNARGVDHISHAALLLGRFALRGAMRPPRESGEIADYFWLLRHCRDVRNRRSPPPRSLFPHPERAATITRWCPESEVRSILRHVR
jgi:hypothetical protein